MSELAGPNWVEARERAREDVRRFERQIDAMSYLAVAINAVLVPAFVLWAGIGRWWTLVANWSVAVFLLAAMKLVRMLRRLRDW